MYRRPATIEELAVRGLENKTGCIQLSLLSALSYLSKIYAPFLLNKYIPALPSLDTAKWSLNIFEIVNYLKSQNGLLLKINAIGYNELVEGIVDEIKPIDVHKIKMNLLERNSATEPNTPKVFKLLYYVKPGNIAHIEPVVKHILILDENGSKFSHGGNYDKNIRNKYIPVFILYLSNRI